MARFIPLLAFVLAAAGMTAASAHERRQFHFTRRPTTSTLIPSVPTAVPSNSNTTPPKGGNSGNKGVWQPAVGATWQIKLSGGLKDTSPNVDVFDVDMENTAASVIADIKAKGKHVICYFSAGSYEPGRSDSKNFQSSDKGKELDGWPGEYWLKLSSQNVRNIMLKRLDAAVAKGCDAVDPDNVDGYDNENGLGLKKQDSIDYVNFLADAAHSRGLAIGLKNAGGIISGVLSNVQFAVNEQCVQYKECKDFQPFIKAGKPVFGIEYPDNVKSISSSDKTKYCTNKDAKGFSTVLKRLELDDFLVACPANN